MRNVIGFVLGLLIVHVSGGIGLCQNTISNESNLSNVTEIARGEGSSTNTGTVNIDGKSVYDKSPTVDGTAPYGAERIRKSGLDTSVATVDPTDSEIYKQYLETVAKNQINIASDGGLTGSGFKVSSDGVSSSGVVVSGDEIRTPSASITDDEIRTGNVRVSGDVVEAGNARIDSGGVRVGSDVGVTSEGVRAGGTEVGSDGITTAGGVSVSADGGVRAGGVSVSSDGSISTPGVSIDASGGIRAGGISVP